MFPEHLAKQTDFVGNKETVVRLKTEYHDLVDGMELVQQVQNCREIQHNEAK